MIVAAVPVKDLVNAKQRLMRVLTPPERSALARAMLCDVLRALRAAPLDRVWVVTREPEIAAIAASMGVETLAEDDNRGHTAAVAAGQAEAARAGAAVFVTIPGDVPCVTASEVRALAAAAADAPAVFVPSHSGQGTNGVALAPPQVMPLRFGEPSFDNHLAAARAGVGPAHARPARPRPRRGRARGPARAGGGGRAHRERPPRRRVGARRAPANGGRGDSLTVPPRYEVIGVDGIGEIRPGHDVARLVVEAAARQSTPLRAGDLLVISQKIVSKAEGRLLRLSAVVPSAVALSMAAGLGRDPRLVEVILRESRRVVRMDRGILVTETHHGWVCANAGVDQSNVDADMVALLPEDPDRSARALRDAFRSAAGGDVGVIIADTFGRPWREGLVNIAIGVAGIAPLKSYLGECDPAGRPLQATILALADELASAAEPVMGKLDRIPAAIVRGLALAPAEDGSKPLLRDPARDLFR